MRKTLKVVPVYAADATPVDPPIREISPKEADEMVDAGVAISLKGRAIRLRKTRASSLSRSPGERAMERYVDGKHSGRDLAAVNAVEGWGPKAYVEAVRTTQF
jgi:hypothetical protein